MLLRRLAIPAFGMLAGCIFSNGGTEVHTVERGTMPRFVKRPTVAVAPLTTSRAGGPGLDPTACAWPTDARVEPCVETFAKELYATLEAADDLNVDAPSTGAADVVVRPHLTFLDPGEALGTVGDRPSRARVRVVIADARGAMIEVLDIESEQEPYLPEPRPGFRVWMDGGVIGEALRAHLRDMAQLE